MLIRAKSYCEIGFFEKLLSIARYHTARPLFRPGPMGNQPFMEIAAATAPKSWLGAATKCCILLN